MHGPVDFLCKDVADLVSVWLCDWIPIALQVAQLHAHSAVMALLAAHEAQAGRA